MGEVFTHRSLISFENNSSLPIFICIAIAEGYHANL